MVETKIKTISEHVVSVKVTTVVAVALVAISFLISVGIGYEKIQARLRHLDGKTDVWSGTSINADAPVIHLNSRIAQRTPANRVKDLGPGETSEYETGVGNKCDDSTKEYNNSKRDNLTMVD